MATTLFEISSYLTTAGIKHRIEEESDQILTAFQTHYYLDSDNEPLLMVLIRLSSDGAFLSMTTPGCYEYFRLLHP